VSQVAPILKIGIRKLAAKLYFQQVNEIQSQVKKEHNPLVISCVGNQTSRFFTNLVSS